MEDPCHCTVEEGKLEAMVPTWVPVGWGHSGCVAAMFVGAAWSRTQEQGWGIELDSGLGRASGPKPRR
jgi:hypothetical protein